MSWFQLNTFSTRWFAQKKCTWCKAVGWNCNKMATITANSAYCHLLLSLYSLHICSCMHFQEKKITTSTQNKNFCQETLTYVCSNFG